MSGQDHSQDNDSAGLNGGRPPPRRSRAEEHALESWRRLILQLAFELEGEVKGRVLMLTRPVEYRRSAEAALELAYFLAEEQGRRVLVVDCAFGRPELSKKFGCAASHGILSLLKPGGEDLVAKVIVDTAHERVSFLPLGSEHEGLAGVAGPEGLRRLLDKLRTEFDYVLLHCRPILEDSTTLAVPSAADCVLLFSSEGVTRLKDLDESQKVLAACKARRVGLVLTTPSRRRRFGRG